MSSRIEDATERNWSCVNRPTIFLITGAMTRRTPTNPRLADCSMMKPALANLKDRMK